MQAGYKLWARNATLKPSMHHTIGLGCFDLYVDCVNFGTIIDPAGSQVGLFSKCNCLGTLFSIGSLGIGDYT